MCLGGSHWKEPSSPTKGTAQVRGMWIASGRLCDAGATITSIPSVGRALGNHRDRLRVAEEHDAICISNLCLQKIQATAIDKSRIIWKGKWDRKAGRRPQDFVRSGLSAAPQDSPACRVCVC